MKKFCILFVVILSISATGQTKYFKLYGGYNLFGAGDVPGYSIKLAYGKNIIKHPIAFASRLYVEAQVSFENGTIQPKIVDADFNEFSSKVFEHVTNTAFALKASYYPFRKVIAGLNVNFGPVVGYGAESSEKGASLITLSNGQTVRSSTLSFNNGLLYGYLLNVGYDIKLTKKIAAGICVELDNYKGDYNSFWGISTSIGF